MVGGGGRLGEKCNIGAWWVKKRVSQGVKLGSDKCIILSPTAMTKSVPFAPTSGRRLLPSIHRLGGWLKL